jgi:UDP-N-acetylmuramoyl-tripeptide--D-alanyl-D-alanine ligase
VPAGETLLEPHLRADVKTITFGPGGEVALVRAGDDGDVTIVAEGELLALQPSFEQAHNLTNLLAAVAAARALGVTPAGRVDVGFSAGRGQLVELPSGVTVIDDCYNANPMSMRAAIDELARVARGRRVAVLGDMLELGERDSARLHREIGEHAAAGGVDVLVAVGPGGREIAAGFAGPAHVAAAATEASAVLEQVVRPGDTILVKASRGLPLESVVERLLAADGGAGPATAAGAPRTGPGDASRPRTGQLGRD